MTRTIIAAAVAALPFALSAAPAAAQPVHSYIERQSQAGQQAKTKASRKKTTGPAQPRSYSGNPAYDVYVNGEYVGSDPDPRVRETLRKEYRGRYGLRD
jgi:Ni/Co efflux regulator RcnB